MENVTFQEKFQNVSSDWLLTGSGEMIISDNKQQVYALSGHTIRYWSDINATCEGVEIFTDYDTSKTINIKSVEYVTMHYIWCCTLN